MRSTWASSRRQARERSFQPRASRCSAVRVRCELPSVEAAGGARRRGRRRRSSAASRQTAACLAIGGAAAHASSETRRALLGAVVVLDRAAHAGLAPQLDQAEAGARVRTW